MSKIRISYFWIIFLHIAVSIFVSMLIIGSLITYRNLGSDQSELDKSLKVLSDSIANSIGDMRSKDLAIEYIKTLNRQYSKPYKGKFFTWIAGGNGTNWSYIPPSAPAEIEYIISTGCPSRVKIAELNYRCKFIKGLSFNVVVLDDIDLRKSEHFSWIVFDLLLYLTICFFIVCGFVYLSFLFLSTRFLEISNFLQGNTYSKKISSSTSIKEVSLIVDSVNKFVENLNLKYQKEASFIQAFSHEVKTPLSAIKLNLAGMKNNDESIDALIEKISKHIDRITLLSDKVSELYLIENKAKERVTVDIEDIISFYIGELLVNDKFRTNIELICNTSLIETDESLFFIAASNLISNAIKYGKGEVCVTIYQSNETGKYVFAVEDNGPGINPEEHDRIFKPYYQSRRNEEGVGLGLSITKRAVERLGGELLVCSSNSLGGAKFIMTFD